MVQCVLLVGQPHETTSLDLQKIDKCTWASNFTGFNFQAPNKCFFLGTSVAGNSLSLEAKSMHHICKTKNEIILK